MLKITIQKEAGGTTLKLEGKLAGPWVDELKRCWQAASGEPGRGSITVRLLAVGFIDAAGRKLLAEMHGQGVKLEASECLTKATVAEIVGEGRAFV